MQKYYHNSLGKQDNTKITKNFYFTKKQDKLKTIKQALITRWN